MEVRPVESLEEFRAAMAVNRTAWRDAYAGILPGDVLDRFEVPEGEALRERYADARRDGQVFLVAADPDAAGSGVAGSGTGHDPGVVAFAQFVRTPDLAKPFVGADEAGLRALYVDPGRQGEGFGSRLLADGLDRLPADTEAVVLETFRDNDAARGFYESRGFALRGEATFEVEGEAYPTVVYGKPV
ncbi:GNAT family N-acetyltransferase [Halorarum salinum]|uniref:GNAT family N-acetyltransferase n=1 Tax=Halorarum salinum TaxID=2743089 RepID=A0A7D5QB97_9EURY|nr:GNAT family N-acetyltransferase [Halobaculum salinum]QLG60841.1 GNAT family N-acetyltransferase [Halobaculum salinum]